MRSKIIELLQDHTSGRPFSLTAHIGRRRQLDANRLTPEDRTVFAALDSAQSNVRVYAERIQDKLRVYGDSLERIFVIGRSGIEDVDFDVSAADEPSILFNQQL